MSLWLDLKLSIYPQSIPFRKILVPTYTRVSVCTFYRRLILQSWLRVLTTSLPVLSVHFVTGVVLEKDVWVWRLNLGYRPSVFLGNLLNLFFVFSRQNVKQNKRNSRETTPLPPTGLSPVDTVSQNVIRSVLGYSRIFVSLRLLDVSSHDYPFHDFSVPGVLSHRLPHRPPPPLHPQDLSKKPNRTHSKRCVDPVKLLPSSPPSSTQVDPYTTETPYVPCGYFFFVKYLFKYRKCEVLL